MPEEWTVQEKLTQVRQYMQSRGFSYEPHLVENLYLSLKAKPFVILAGSTGVGKSSLVRLFAQAVGGQLLTVVVQPDWCKTEDLDGAVAEFIRNALQYRDTPYFLCLEEMNLARAEYYFSDFLAAMETRTCRENAIWTDAIRLSGQLVSLPENLYIFGTVNMDETTFALTNKLLDRANVIELATGELLPGEMPEELTAPLGADNGFLKAQWLGLADCPDRQLAALVCRELNEVQKLLQKADLQISYRARDGIVVYMEQNQRDGLLSADGAMDRQLLQRILPQIRGSSPAIREVLSALFVICAGEYRESNGFAWQQMENYLQNKPCKYPQSAKKLAFMMRRYEEDGFAAYWH